MSFWPFIVALLALFVVGFAWFNAGSERDTALLKAKRLEDENGKLKKDAEDANTRLVKATHVVGFDEGGYVSEAVVTAQIAEYSKSLREAMTIKFPTSKYQVDPAGGGGTVEKTEGDTVTVAYVSEAELAEVQSLQGFFGKMLTAAKRMQHDISWNVDKADQESKAKAGLITANDAALKEKDKRIDELTREKAAVQASMDEQGTELRNNVAQLTAQKEAKDQEMEQVRKQSTENETKLLAQLNDARGQVKTLVQRDAPTLTEGPDGEVVVARDGLVVINRGKNNWLMPGTVFQVSGRAKGGATYPKGTIKVTTCDDESARAVILEEVNSRDPITQGDTIKSDVYSPNRKLHFVLVGEFKKMGRSMAETRLRQLGAIVDDRATAETNYVVVGTPGAGQTSLDDTDAVKTAHDLGLRMITEEQLASFCRY